MDHKRNKLAEVFGRQQDFTAEYSPLYSRLFGAVATWLRLHAEEDDPLVEWLLESARGRGSLDVTLLLAAGLHRDILAGNSAAAELARYYPTAGGDLPFDAPEFEEALRKVILAREEPLAKFIQEANVQTNETGRGLCWLLPAYYVGWPSVHLVDLGASAGLNLVADTRAYRLMNLDDNESQLDIGHGNPVQFITRHRGGKGMFGRLRNRRPPVTESRSGCDANPFSLEKPADELALKSFIWGDQVGRMRRLQEGIEAYRQVQQSTAPVNVFVCDLPGGLGRFLSMTAPLDSPSPVVIYNTYMTPYLRDKGTALFEEIDHWVAQQARPVLWLQWEPARDGREPPVMDWIVWTADLWQAGSHQHWEIGWVHPHGGEAVFNEGLGLGDLGMGVGD